MSHKVQEYLAFSTSSDGLLVPFVAVLKPNSGPITYRDILKDDIQRIPEEYNVPGGWFFKRNYQSNTSWTRRYGLLRGKYMFLFHSPLNEKPIGVIPLNNGMIVTPEDGLKSFDQRSAQNNEGYEWEIQAPDGNDARIYSLSAGERAQWVEACRERSTRREESAPMQLLLGQRIPSKAGSNVTITTTRLEGDSPAEMALNEGQSQYSASNPFYPPPPPPPPFEDDEFRRPSNAFVAQQPPQSFNQTAGRASMIARPTDQPPSLTQNRTPNFGNYAVPPPPPPPADNPDNWDEARSVDSRDHQSVSTTHVGNEYERAMLEQGIQSVIKVQDDAKKRENARREQNHSEDSLRAAQEREAANPMTLSEMLRCMLMFMHEILCEDPLPNLPLQIPYLKGDYAEGMVTSAYQTYCDQLTGYMTLEGFVEFMDDLAITNTHVPHDDTDAPLQQYEALLDPVRLLTTIPRTLGTSVEMQKDSMLRRKSMHAATAAASEQADGLSVNFTQFYQLLLKITQIVYKDLYEKDMTVAMNSFLLESLCPLMAWCKGHCKRGSTDILVTEERIPLLLLTYSPNLWKVFLMYAHNSIKKAPDGSALNFPDSAKQNEKYLFGVPPGAPNRVGAAKDYLVISESSFLRLCSEYALCPQLCSIKECKEIFQRCNRAKNIVKTVTRDIQAPTAASQLTRAAKGKTTSIFQKRRPSSSPMYFGKSDEARNPLPPPAPGPGHTDPVALPPVQLATGLGFTEFIEAISSIAVEGMQQENYNILFPTPFSKVIAVLTSWGLADLRKLEDVKAIHTIAVDVIN